ncbi:MAG: acetyltransferase, gnat family [Planctomycetota bacterium]|nr:acetyltransferase, gnat family [Planctomycetota bacterium]
MIDDWFDVIRLPISMKQFLGLPQNPAYKYEYLGTYALLSPRPKCYHAVLDLKPVDVPEPLDARGPILVRPLRDGDWEHFPALFSAAFDRVQPFAALDEDRSLEASRHCLDKTRTGGDGPLVPSACFVAVTREDDKVVGAALVTLQNVPEDDESDPWAAGRVHPHLTWIFVAPMRIRHGIGSALLAATVGGLIGLGHARLVSTFLLGNESSTLWHWRNGFRLLSYDGSPRRMRKRADRRDVGSANVRTELSEEGLP